MFSSDKGSVEDEAMQMMDGMDSNWSIVLLVPSAGEYVRTGG